MRIFTSVYVLLLAYIIVALVFWEVSLQKQSGRIFAQEVLTLKRSIDSTKFPSEYNAQMASVSQNLHNRTLQYIGEGSTFMVVIVIGASVVYSSFRRRIRLSRQQNNFMLSVTHELKSPIAAMKLNLQTLERHKLDESKQAQLLERCIREANRLNDLCNNILFASRLEGRQHRLSVETIDLADLVEDTLGDYANRYPGRFTEDALPGCRIKGDKAILQIVLGNLLENAVKYSPAGTPITVAIRQHHNDAVLSVADEGPGIPDAEKKKVFTRFYRVGNEESRKATGTGLGLYLAERMVLQHGGRLLVKDNTPKGAIFEIWLPLAPKR